MASGSRAASTVDFPISESPQRQANAGPPVKVPHLPFRRISLPTVPSLLHRVSVVSVASFDPFPEVPEGPPQTPRQQVKPQGTKVSQSRPVSIVSPRRRNPRRDSSVKPVDDRLAAKCRKIIDEFYETEKAYVDGLELIYSHFLTPIIISLDTPEPLLNRSALTSIFSNFIDIWNLHRSFLSALTALLEPAHNVPSSPSSPSKLSSGPDAPLPKLSPLLLAHFPYLSLYTPFITAFPSTISALSDLITPPTTTKPNPQYNQRFAAFLATQESDARCNKLKMRDWLLTIVQRCPRYLLLLKDLINSTNKDDPEHVQLTAVHTLVSKITLSLNTSLQTHAQTMSLLALQKATPNLPFQLISPGRTLLKRGTLLQAERSENPVEREFLVFSDCMVWLAPAGGESSLAGWDWSWSGSGASGSGSGVGNGNGNGGVGGSSSGIGVTQSQHNTPVSKKRSSNSMTRTRSKSEAELGTTTRMDPDMPLASAFPSSYSSSVGVGPSRPFNESAGATADNDKGKDKDPSPSTSRPVTPQRQRGATATATAPAPAPAQPPPPPNMAKRYPSTDDKWVYKGRVDLVDAQIIVGSALEDERKFEVLSPEGSFVVYAASASERDEWTTEIRGAKAQLLISLNITNPNSTLTSSASTNHVRRALQALPYHPSDDRLSTLRGSSSMDAIAVAASASHASLVQAQVQAQGKSRFGRKDKDKAKRNGGGVVSGERRRKVEHWVPAIWIPDGKTSSCMRCGRMFGWRRRRHHCRLCGRCVCAGCSGQTFYITDANASKPETSSKPARACDACYESVFPLIRPSRENSESEVGLAPPQHPFTEGADNQEAEAETHSAGADTIASLSRLPSWLSMPALPVRRQQHQPHALMDFDVNGNGNGNSSRDFELENEGGLVGSGNGNGNGSGIGGNEILSSGDDGRERRARLRVKSHQKLRSYHQILEDFQEQAARAAQTNDITTLEMEDDDKFDDNAYNSHLDEEAEEEDEEKDGLGLDEEDQDQIDMWLTPTHSLASSPVSSPRKPQRREDTARRSKRFSLPAIALHTTSVTARTAADVGGDGGVGSGSGSGAGTGASASPLSRESSEPVGRSRRFSLVSGSRNSYYHPDASSPTRRSGIGAGAGGVGGIDDSGDLARGLAAARLSELLGRKTGVK